MKRAAFVLLITMALMACKREQSAPSTTGQRAPAPQATGTVALAAVSASAVPAAVAPAGLFADQLPKGLPEFDRTPVELDVMNRSTDIDTEADKAKKRKDYAKAIELYVEALKVDPGNRGARYYLASSLVLNGQLEAGLGVIDQFHRAEDCYPCKGLLFEMTQDKDFATVRGQLEFKERTQDAAKRLLTVERAAEIVLKWLGKPQLDNLTPFADTRTFMILEQAGVGFKQFKGAKAFIEYVVDQEKEHFPKGRKWGGKVGAPTGMYYKCPNECCEIDTYEDYRDRSILRQLCFKTKGNVAISLYKLKVK